MDSVTEGLNLEFCLILINLDLKEPYMAYGYNIGYCRPKLFKFQKNFFVILLDNLEKW